MNKNMKIKDIQIRPAEIPDLLNLFADTVANVCSSDYNKDQVRVWISSGKNTGRWKEKIEMQYFLVALFNGLIVGFGSLENENKIDVLYVHKDYQRHGIANKLFDELEKEAILKGSEKIKSDISITALPFFKKRGFSILNEQVLNLDGVEITNYKMKKG